MPGRISSQQAPQQTSSSPPAPAKGHETEAGKAFGRKATPTIRFTSFLKRTLSRGGSIIKRPIASFFNALKKLFRGRRVSESTALTPEKEARGVIPDYRGKVKKPPTLESFKQGRKLGAGTFGEVSLATNQNDPASTNLDKLYVVKTQRDILLAKNEAKLQKNIPFAPDIYDEKIVATGKTDPETKQTIQSHSMLMAYGGSSLSALMKSWMPADKISPRRDATKEHCTQVEANTQQAAEKYWTPPRIRRTDDQKIAVPEELACNVGRQIMFYLKKLHRNNYAHRDIKPDNLLITHQGQINIVDYGLAKKGKNDELISSSLTGTPLYHAPEMDSGQPYSTKVDMWSTGIVLTQLLTGECPWLYTSRIVKTKDKDGKVRKEEKYSLNPQAHTEFIAFIKSHARLSAEAKSLLIQMLEPDPLKRISSSEALEHPFFTGSDGQPVSSYPNLQTEHARAFKLLAEQEALQATIISGKAPSSAPSLDKVKESIVTLQGVVKNRQNQMHQLDQLQELQTEQVIINRKLTDQKKLLILVKTGEAPAGSPNTKAIRMEIERLESAALKIEKTIKLNPYQPTP